MHNCDFCGTEVGKQYNVCSGCGAVYRPRLRNVFLSVVFLVPIPFMAVYVAWQGYQEDKMAFIDYLLAPTIIVLSALLAYKAVKRSFKRRWLWSRNPDMLDLINDLNRPVGFQKNQY